MIFLQAVAEEKGFEIIETKLHEGTAANIDSEVTDDSPPTLMW